MKIDCIRQTWTERTNISISWAPVGAKKHFSSFMRKFCFDLLELSDACLIRPLRQRVWKGFFFADFFVDSKLCLFYVTETEPNRDENRDKHSEASQSFDNKILPPQYTLLSEHQVESDSRRREIESTSQRANADENIQRPDAHFETLHSDSPSLAPQGKCKNQKSSKKPTSFSNALCVPKLGRWK